MLTCALLASCCRPPDLNGIWIASTTDSKWHALLMIEGDTISLVNCVDLSKVSHPMHLACDSLNGPEDRLAFTMIGDTVFFDPGMIMYKPNRVVQADIHTHIHEVYLKEASTRYNDGPSTYFTPLFIGPCQEISICSDSFLGGHGLGIQDQYADSADLSDWLVYARTEWPEGSPRTAVVYPDTSVSQGVVNELADRIHSGLNGDVTVYQGFFLPSAEYFLTFDILRKPVEPSVEQ